MTKVVIAGGLGSELAYSTTSNPTFDNRLFVYNLLSTPTPFSNQKGMMFNTDATASSPRYTVNFLFNPTTISLDHSVDTNIPDPASMSADDLGIAMGPLQQTLSFSLLFDRTYECWDPKYANTDIANNGVYLDIRSIYNMVGITSPVDQTAGQVQGSTGAGGTSATASSNQNIVRQPLTFTPSGPMRMTPIRFLFAGSQSITASGFSSGLSYYGYMSDLSIEYTHFTQNMVPTRAEVDITAQLMIDTILAPGAAVLVGAPGDSSTSTVVGNGTTITGAPGTRLYGPGYGQ
jgi:hypothetical protein